MPQKFETIIAQEKFVVLDTETTGLQWPAEIVSIAIIDHKGNMLLNTLVKPVKPIPGSATHVHGIKDADVVDAPTWADVKEQVLALIAGHHVVTYNAEYDRRMCDLADKALGLPETNYDADGWHCAMEWYAEIYGDWNDWHQSYTWKKLSKAIKQQGLPLLNAHGALDDCRMTLSLIRKLTAPKEAPSETGALA
jgi:DNA polymerase-3 subunit epsilon